MAKSRKKSCNNCLWWECREGEWGYCLRIDSWNESDLPARVSYDDSMLECSKDFYCILWENWNGKEAA